ncbi:DUF1206 domain-containing protein [Porphyrobacter sp. GA68]|uniref:DUF1206 domain-containing protein n=1 Tax=Porphyrobacter sp. GA68 TaxID=2883480 RepID=UPI001D17D8B1|nr:DUF1206 domain-containing protein [Porphyrobacter sp. GA68]
MVDKSEKFETLVRVGYFSRAIMYSVLGVIALMGAAAFAEGTDGVFRAIRDFPGGTALLWILVIGLSAYGLFRLASPAFDIENSGSDAKGWGKRLGHLGSGIGHFALAYTAYKFATAGNSSGGGAQEAAAGVLSYDFGGAVLGLLGIAFFVAAAHQAKRAWTAEFMQRVAAGAPDYTETLGRIGFAARAVVFAIIGWSLIRAGFLSAGSAQVKTLGEALASLAGNGIVFSLVAVGLLVFGIFSLILARYRIIPDMDPRGKVPAFRA